MWIFIPIFEKLNENAKIKLKQNQFFFSALKKIKFFKAIRKNLKALNFYLKKNSFCFYYSAKAYPLEQIFN